jgi:hypothetical protein
MNTTIDIALRSNMPGCAPLSCGLGGLLAVELKSDSVAKGRDGSGWVIGTIIAKPYPLNTVGPSDWVYKVAFDEAEFSDEVINGDLAPLVVADIANGDGAIGLCCLQCGDLMLLDKIAAIQTRTLNRESFRLFAHDEEIAIGVHRLFRNHSAIEIHAIEVSCEEHLTGYPAVEPQSFAIRLVRTEPQQAGPFNDATTLDAILSPASTTPLTAKVEFAPPLIIPAGAGVGVNINSSDPAQHLGLEVHIDFRVIDES